MKAAVLHTPSRDEPLRVESIDVPSPLGADVLVRIHACGVCRTDLQLCEGDLAARRLPIVPGHQIVGTIEQAGPDISVRRVGERVGISWIAGSCGVCRFCRSGRENLCLAATFTGWDRDGGFAEYVAADERYVYPLPDGYSDIEIAPLLCGGVIGYRCLEAAQARSGMKIGLYGFGSSATTVLQLALRRGCEVYVVTRSEAEQHRAAALGAIWTGSYAQRPPHPLDAAITFAPAGSVVVAALEAIDRGGVVVVNAIHLDHIPQFDYAHLWWERSIRSVANLTRQDAAGFLAEAAKARLMTHTDVYELNRANRALSDLRDGKVRGSAVIAIG